MTTTPGWVPLDDLKGPQGPRGPEGPQGPPLARDTTYAAAGTADGFHENVALDYVPASTDAPVPFMVKARAVGVSLRRAFWLNESGAPRAAAVADEAALKLYGPPSAFPGTYNSSVLEIVDKDGGTPRWGIDVQGRQRLGTSKTVGGVIVSLATGAAIPSPLPTGTFILQDNALRILNANGTTTLVLKGAP